MTFEPKTPEQIAAEMLLRQGEYDFYVYSGRDTVSKSSNVPMIELHLRIATEGKPRYVTDYISARYPKKLREAATACDAFGKQIWSTLAVYFGPPQVVDS